MQPDAPHADEVIFLDLDAHRAQAAGGGAGIFRGQEAGDGRLALRQRAEEQRAVGDRFIAGHGNRAAERSAGGDKQ